MKSSLSYQKGFTLLEIVLVVGILTILLSIAFVSIGNIRVISTNNSTSSVIVSDLKNQQVRAMVGDTEGRGIPDNYGIKILPTQYVLFHGDSYNASDTTNYAIPVSTGFTLSSTFTNGIILFASESGELVNFVANHDTITLTNTTSNQIKTIHLNKYGTVTSID
jgi:prepilin-type N-terminal cleavage/methylation domain-containing protein